MVRKMDRSEALTSSELVNKMEHVMTAVVDSLADFGDPAVVLFSGTRSVEHRFRREGSSYGLSKDACRNGADPVDYKVPIPAVTR